MKRIVLALAFISLSASLCAADPIIGTWRLNLAQSRLPKDADSPREITDVYRELDRNRMELDRTSILNNGSPDPSRWIWPTAGGQALRTSPSPLPNGVSYIETFVAPGRWYVTIMSDGKQLLTMRKTVSEEGRRLEVAIKGVSLDGTPIDQIMIFDRQ